MSQEVNSNQEEKNKKRYWPYLFFLALLLFFCVFGITYSIYYGNNEEQEINTGQIIFSYSEVGQASNGIILEDAYPTIDLVGKAMVGRNQYFDFSVTASTPKTNLLYKILIKKDEQSTLSDNQVRIYLTEVMGSYEQEVLISDFSDLTLETINKNQYYVLYEKILDKNLKDYSDSYRLRMWIKDTAQNYEQQFFSVRVDVQAYQIKE